LLDTTSAPRAEVDRPDRAAFIAPEIDIYWPIA